MKSNNPEPSSFSILMLPMEMQVNMLTYLRAYDLAKAQQTCTFYASKDLVHAIVVHTATRVYPPALTHGFELEATSSDNDGYYTYEHLRNMEFLVVARVLNSPEPTTGYIVSRSWCKTALQWLEAQQTVPHSKTPKKKASKRQQRVRNRKLSDASPPWPNVNTDLLCEHLCLQRCTSRKSARARRRLVDKQSWKVLNLLYPDSTQLPSSMGECWQCSMQAERVHQSQLDRMEQEKLHRKRPLSHSEIRRFYTRRTGVPQQCLVPNAATTTCPLVPGRYYILPRSWCHGWRKFIRTGEGSAPSSLIQWEAPDAAGLLCDAHRLLLLPPHLEAFLSGKTRQLLASSAAAASTSTSSILEEDEGDMDGVPAVATAAAALPGQDVHPTIRQTARDAGLSDREMREQLSAMRLLEQQQQQQQIQRQPPAAAMPVSTENRNELLDRENHSVVELLSEAEYLALEQCWPGSTFGIGFVVDAEQGLDFTTPVCRECDATGRQCALSIKNRARQWVRKSSERSRAPASLEY
jgi:hypothetical protein